MNKSKLGFTLIELLIVIAIIGILAVAFLPNVMGAPAKARDTQRVADVQKIAGIVTTGQLTGKALPDTGCITLDTSTPPVWGSYSTADFGGSFPTDPSPTNLIGGCTTSSYYFVKGASGSSYSFVVMAKVEVKDNGNYDIATVPTDDTDLSAWTMSATSGAYYVVLIQ